MVLVRLGIMAAVLSIISWNIASKRECWSALKQGESIDVALVQEAVPPDRSLLLQTTPGMERAWGIEGWTKRFCAAVARLSARVTMIPISTRPLADLDGEGIGVSRPGTLAAAEIEVAGEVITVVSLYAAWERARGGRLSYADGSAHRLISDLCWLLDRQWGHKIIAAGDLNIYRGHGEQGSPYWRDRYLSVFSRMEALGLPFVGPQHPNGIQAEPWPTHLPDGSRNVPTFRTRWNEPASGSFQLDFVFASPELHKRLTVTALNRPEEWGPSDHCRVRIDLASP